MGMNTNSSGSSDKNDGESKVQAAVIGVGVGLAAGFAAPLMAGVALSAIGFTSAGTRTRFFTLLPSIRFWRKSFKVILCWHILGVASGSMAASWEASGGSLFATLRSFGVSGISGSIAAGLGAVFGTAAVVLTTLFGKKKTEPIAEKQAEPIEEKPVHVSTFAPVATESVKFEKRDDQVKEVHEPVAAVVVKNVSESISKNASAVQRSEAVVEAQIISIPETKGLQEEAMPIQSELHFEAVQAMENQIIQAASNVEKE